MSYGFSVFRQQQRAGNFNRKISLLISFILTSISVSHALYVYSIYLELFFNLIKHHDKYHFLLLDKFMSEKVGFITYLQWFSYKIHVVAQLPNLGKTKQKKTFHVLYPGCMANFGFLWNFLNLKWFFQFASESFKERFGHLTWFHVFTEKPLDRITLMF